MRPPLGPYPGCEPDAPAHAVRDQRPRIVQRRRVGARLHAVGGVAADRAARARDRDPARRPRAARRLPDRRGTAARAPRRRRAARAREGPASARRAVVDAGDPPARGRVPDRDGHDRRAGRAQLRRGAGRRVGPGARRRAGRGGGPARPPPRRRRGALRLRAHRRRGRDLARTGLPVPAGRPPARGDRRGRPGRPRRRGMVRRRRTPLGAGAGGAVPRGGLHAGVQPAAHARLRRDAGSGRDPRPRRPDPGAGARGTPPGRRDPPAPARPARPAAALRGRRCREPGGAALPRPPHDGRWCVARARGETSTPGIEGGESMHRFRVGRSSRA